MKINNLPFFSAYHKRLYTHARLLPNLEYLRNLVLPINDPRRILSAPASWRGPKALDYGAWVHNPRIRPSPAPPGLSPYDPDAAFQRPTQPPLLALPPPPPPAAPQPAAKAAPSPTAAPRQPAATAPPTAAPCQPAATARPTAVPLQPAASALPSADVKTLPPLPPPRESVTPPRNVDYRLRDPNSTVGVFIDHCSSKDDEPAPSGKRKGNSQSDDRKGKDPVKRQKRDPEPKDEPKEIAMELRVLKRRIVNLRYRNENNFKESRGLELQLGQLRTYTPADFGSRTHATNFIHSPQFLADFGKPVQRSIATSTTCTCKCTCSATAPTLDGPAVPTPAGIASSPPPSSAILRPTPAFLGIGCGRGRRLIDRFNPPGSLRKEESEEEEREREERENNFVDDLVDLSRSETKEF